MAKIERFDGRKVFSLPRSKHTMEKKKKSKQKTSQNVATYIIDNKGP